jgi:hypothetical protein
MGRNQWADGFYRAIKDIVIPLLICVVILIGGWTIVSFVKNLYVFGIILGIIGIGGVVFIVIKNKNWIPKKTTA